MIMSYICSFVLSPAGVLVETVFFSLNNFVAGLQYLKLLRNIHRKSICFQDCLGGGPLSFFYLTPRIWHCNIPVPYGFDDKESEATRIETLDRVQARTAVTAIERQIISNFSVETRMNSDE